MVNHPPINGLFFHHLQVVAGIGLPTLSHIKMAIFHTFFMYFSAQSCPQKWQVRLSDPQKNSTNWTDPRNKLDKERAEFAVPWRMGCMAWC